MVVFLGKRLIWSTNCAAPLRNMLDPSTPRFFGRRKGRSLRLGRKAALEELAPLMELALPEHPVAKLAYLFPDKKCHAYAFEIGFGNGEHLASQCRAHKDWGFLGAEVFVNGISNFLKDVSDDPPQNVRLFQDDVRKLLPLLPDHQFQVIYLLFPDPWPKTKHGVRRFIQKETLDQLSRLLAPGGEFRMASDDMNYIRWSLMQILDHGKFVMTANGPQDWLERGDDWPVSRYEMKAIEKGRQPIYLRFSAALAK